MISRQEILKFDTPMKCQDEIRRKLHRIKEAVGRLYPSIALHEIEQLVDRQLELSEPAIRQAPSDPADIAANKTAEGT